jgi:exodeoxyribonuclease-3
VWPGEGTSQNRPVLTVVTANVNGIRAAARRGGLDWLAACGADVLALQEVRATHEQLHDVLSGSGLAGWEVAHSPAASLGRAGVAVLTRGRPKAVRTAADVAPFAGEFAEHGRWLEVDLSGPAGPLTVVSAYVHTGEADTPRQDEKYRFLDAMDERLAALAAGRRDVVVAGDLNVARTEHDIKNWRGNRGKAGFLEGERAYLDRWTQGRWTDLGRALGGDGPGPYTWWSWRGRGFDTDGGWRIDYVLATPRLAARAESTVVAKAPSYAERWSDHAPVVVRFGKEPVRTSR